MGPERMSTRTFLLMESTAGTTTLGQTSGSSLVRDDNSSGVEASLYRAVRSERPIGADHVLRDLVRVEIHRIEIAAGRIDGEGPGTAPRDNRHCDDREL